MAAERPVTALFVGAVALSLIVAALILAAIPPHGVAPLQFDTVLFAVQFVPLTAAGTVIAARRPRHPIGWLLLSVGVAFGGGGVLASAAREFYGPEPAAGAVITLAGNQLFKLVFAAAAVLFLIFPSGTLRSRRSRALVVALGIVLVLAAAAEVLAPGAVTDYLVRRPPDNPLGIPQLATPAKVVSRVGFLAFACLVIAAAASLVIRYRNAEGEERLQLKWFALAATAWALTAVADGLFRAIAGGGQWPELPLQVAYVLGASAMAAGIAIAVLRHRLFDIDLVISRSVAYVALALVITAVYIAVVAGIGALLARTSSKVILAILTTAGVAAAFQPLRARLELAARRLVYGPNARSYEALASFTEQLRAGRGLDDVMPRIGEVLAAGTRCDEATLWLRQGGRDVVASSWPSAPEAVAPDAATRTAAIRIGDRVLGCLAVHRRSGGRLSPTEERLMDGLATQAALLLENHGLERELRVRLSELQASRQRLVAVQNEERRRLERDLHDGAQQDLVALKLKLGLASAAAVAGGPEVQATLGELQRDIGRALDSLRDLSRGIYPPLLEAEGLRAAVQARARGLPFAVDIRCDDSRLGRELERAIYFCCSEALQNVAKHAEPTLVSIRVAAVDGALELVVADDGRGCRQTDLLSGCGVQNMRDRIEALGGCLVVESALGVGTVVRARVPSPVGEPDPHR